MTCHLSKQIFILPKVCLSSRTAKLSLWEGLEQHHNVGVEVFLPPSTCRALQDQGSSFLCRCGELAAAWPEAAAGTDPLQLEFQHGFSTVNDVCKGHLLWQHANRIFILSAECSSQTGKKKIQPTPPFMGIPRCFSHSWGSLHLPLWGSIERQSSSPSK